MDKKIMNLYFATHKTCNMNCSYCYVPENNRKQKKISDDFILNSLNDFIQKVENENYQIGAFCFHGTEATLMSAENLSEAIVMINEHWKQNKIKKFQVAIQTNGKNLKREYFDKLLRKISPNQLKIGFSIDPPKQVHNQIRDNSWELINYNYQLAKKLGFKVSVLSVVTKETLKYIDEFVDWVKLELHQNRSVGNPYKIKIKFATGKFGFSPKDFEYFADILIQNDLLSLPQILTPGYCLPNGNKCMWFEFDIDGNCYSCNKAYNDNGIFANWYEDSFQKIFEIREKLYNLHFVSEECSNCPYEFVCNGGCPIDRWQTGKLKGKAHECLIIKRVYDYILNERNINILEFYENNV